MIKRGKEEVSFNETDEQYSKVLLNKQQRNALEIMKLLEQEPRMTHHTISVKTGIPVATINNTLAFIKKNFDLHGIFVPKEKGSEQ